MKKKNKQTPAAYKVTSTVMPVPFFSYHLPSSQPKSLMYLLRLPPSCTGMLIECADPSIGCTTA